MRVWYLVKFYYIPFDCKLRATLIRAERAYRDKFIAVCNVVNYSRMVRQRPTVHPALASGAKTVKCTLYFLEICLLIWRKTSSASFHCWQKLQSIPRADSINHSSQFAFSAKQNETYFKCNFFCLYRNWTTILLCLILPIQNILITCLLIWIITKLQ